MVLEQSHRRVFIMYSLCIIILCLREGLTMRIMNPRSSSLYLTPTTPRPEPAVPAASPAPIIPVDPANPAGPSVPLAPAGPAALATSAGPLVPIIPIAPKDPVVSAAPIVTKAPAVPAGPAAAPAELSSMVPLNQRKFTPFRPRPRPTAGPPPTTRAKATIATTRARLNPRPTSRPPVKYVTFRRPLLIHDVTSQSPRRTYYYVTQGTVRWNTTRRRRKPTPPTWRARPRHRSHEHSHEERQRLRFDSQTLTNGSAAGKYDSKKDHDRCRYFSLHRSPHCVRWWVMVTVLGVTIVIPVLVLVGWRMGLMKQAAARCIYCRAKQQRQYREQNNEESSAGVAEFINTPSGSVRIRLARHPECAGRTRDYDLDLRNYHHHHQQQQQEAGAEQRSRSQQYLPSPPPYRSNSITSQEAVKHDMIHCDLLPVATEQADAKLSLAEELLPPPYPGNQELMTSGRHLQPDTTQNQRS